MKNLEYSYTYLSGYLAEPVSSITDILLALISFYFFYRITQFKQKGIVERKWAQFFLLLSYSTLAGGIAHAIYLRESNPTYDLIWLFMQYFSGLAVYYAQNAAIQSEINRPRIQMYLLQAANLQFLAFFLCMLYFFNFKVVAINSSIAIIELICLYFFSRKGDWEHRALIGLGFLTSVLTVYVNRTKLAWTWWFNHNDISHVIMFFSMLLIYKGVKNKFFKESIVTNKLSEGPSN